MHFYVWGMPFWQSGAVGVSGFIIKFYKSQVKNPKNIKIVLSSKKSKKSKNSFVKPKTQKI